MHYYNVTIRLSGNTQSEIRKTVSAPELLLLEFIHGEGACVNAEEIKNVKINMLKEKNRLRELYDMGLARLNQSVDNIFGALGKLPERLPQELLERYNIYSDALRAEDTGEAHRVAKTEYEQKNEEKIISADEVNLNELVG